MLTWTCATAIPRRSTKILIGILITIATLQAIWGIAVFHSHFSFIDSSPFTTNRAIGTFSSGNSFGGFITIAIILTLGALLSIAPPFLNNLRRHLHSRSGTGYLVLTLPALFFALIAQIVALIMSGSRGAMLSTLLCSAIMILWFAGSTRNKNRKKTFLMLFSLSFLLFLIGTGGTYLLSFSRFHSLTSGTDFSAATRLGIWKSSLDLLFTFPLGVGPGCFVNAFTRFRPAEGFGATRVFHAHNDYIEILCEWGIPGALLLLVLFIWIARRAISVDRNSNNSKSIWLWRGVLMAAIAGLLHAFVDFNLSSRPGVAVFFFILLGISLRHDEQSFSRSTKTSNLSPLRIGITVLMAFIIVFSGIRQTRLTIASWHTEKGFVALGGKPNPYFWLKPSPVLPEAALKCMNRAAQIAPFSAKTHLMLGRGRILDYNRRLKLTVNENIKHAPASSVESIRSAVEIAMLKDHAETLAKARVDLTTALTLAPTNPDAYAYRSEIEASLARLAESPEEKLDLLDKTVIDIQKAVCLAPHDATVLSVVCRALSLSVCSYRKLDDKTNSAAANEMLKLYGQRALATSMGLQTTILRSWAQAGISLEDALESHDLPLSVLWKAYLHYKNADETQNAITTLSKLESACIAAPQKEKSKKEKERARKNARRYSSLFTRERSRLALQTGNLNLYAELLERRRIFLFRHINNILSRSKATEHNDRITFLRLKRILNTRGLDFKNSLLFCRLALQENEYSAANQILSEISTFTTPEQINTLASAMNSNPMKTASGFGFELARICIAISQDRFQEANDRLAELCHNSKLPFPLKHRIDLLKSQCLQNMGFPAQAQKILEGALEVSPNDPDLLKQFLSPNGSTLDASSHSRFTHEQHLSDLTPDHRIDMEYFGGRIALHGLSVTDNELTIFWRFRGHLPSDLLAFVLLQKDKKTIFGKKLHFNKTATKTFAAGNPQIGSVFKQVIKLGKVAEQSGSLLIGLQTVSKKGWILSSEALPLLRIRNWQKHLIKHQNLQRSDYHPIVARNR